MAEGRVNSHVPVVVTIVIALMLSILPLPEKAAPFRPDWVALVLIYWAVIAPRSYSVGTAWVLGLVVDVAHGTLFGQHALALVAVVFITSRFYLQLRVFPMSQLTATVFALLALYQFLLFWVNGVAGVSAPSSSYWGPVLTGTLLFPLLFPLFNGVVYRARGHG